MATTNKSASAGVRLTKALIEARIHQARQDGKRIILRDNLQKGLQAIVGPRGATFSLRYVVRTADGSTQRKLITFGRWGTPAEAPAPGVFHDLDAVRQTARELTARAARGDDPQLDGLRPNEPRTPTLADACERYFAEHGPNKKPSSLGEDRRHARIALEHLGADTLITAIAAKHIADLRHKRRSTPTDCNRSLAFLSKLMRLCELWEWRPRNSNPVTGVERFRERPRELFLTQEQLGELARTLDEMEREGSITPPVANCVRLLMYSGLRRDEARCLRWEWVKADRIDLPDTKTGARSIPLAAPAMAAIQAMRPYRGPQGVYVFESLRCPGRPVGGSLCWGAIRERAGLPPKTTLHCLRHSYASAAIAAGLPVTVVGKLLGHRVLATTMRYVHANDRQAAEAAAVVAKHIAGVARKNDE